jgi:hypothetical protein
MAEGGSRLSPPGHPRPYQKHPVRPMPSRVLFLSKAQWHSNGHTAPLSASFPSDLRLLTSDLYSPIPFASMSYSNIPAATARLSDVAFPRMGSLSTSSHTANCSAFSPSRSLPSSKIAGLA